MTVVNPSPVVVSPAPVVITAEAGQHTTEFWAAHVSSAVLMVLGVLDATGLFHIDDQARAGVLAAIVPTIGLIQSAYAVSRGLRKRGTQG